MIAISLRHRDQSSRDLALFRIAKLTICGTRAKISVSGLRDYVKRRFEEGLSGRGGDERFRSAKLNFSLSFETKISFQLTFFDL